MSCADVTRSRDESYYHGKTWNLVGRSVASSIHGLLMFTNMEEKLISSLQSVDVSRSTLFYLAVPSYLDHGLLHS